MTNYIPNQHLNALLSQEKIILEYLPLKNLDGFYLQLQDFKIIGIHENIVDDLHVYRSVLAEELGHHFTIISNKQPSEYLTYSDRLDLDKSESAALRWAADFLIPTPALLEFISDNKSLHLQDIQDEFQVTDYLVHVKFNKLAAKEPYYQLSDGRNLVLTHLPDIHIFEPF